MIGADVVAGGEVAGRGFVRDRNEQAGAFVERGDVGVVQRAAEHDPELPRVVTDGHVDRGVAGIHGQAELAAVDDVGGGAAGDGKHGARDEELVHVNLLIQIGHGDPEIATAVR